MVASRHEFVDRPSDVSWSDQKRILAARLSGLLSTRASRVALAALPGVAWVLLLLETFAARAHKPLAAAAAWGLLLTWSFVAWGRLVVRAVAPRLRAGWGLEGTLGVALALVAGGALACFRLVSVTTILSWVVIGVVGESFVRVRAAIAAAPRPPHLRAVRNGAFAVLAATTFGLLALLLLAYAGAVENSEFNA